MAKQTQKQRIEDLENKVTELLAIIEANEKVITEMQDKANEDFANSNDKLQMQKQIDDLKLQLKSSEHSKELAETKSTARDKEIQKLKVENNDLNIKIAKQICENTDLKAHIKKLEGELHIAEFFNNENKVGELALKATQRGRRIEELENEIKRLQGSQPRHNARGAGRKSIVDDKRKELIKMYRAQGMTIKSIAEQENLSIGLVHKILNS